MFFILKKKRWYAFFAKVHPLFCYLATCMVAILLVWGWYCFIYQPLCLQTACLQQEIEHVNLQAAQNNVTLQRAKKQEDAIHQLKKEIRSYSQGLVFSQQVQRIAHALLKNIAAYTMRLTSYSCSELVVYDWYARQSLSFVINDVSLQELTSFLIRMSQDHLFSCTMMQLKRKDDSTTFSVVCTLDCLGIA